MGSNSLKLYLVDRAGGAPSVDTLKFPWRIAHELFATGRLSAAGVDEIVDRVEQARARAGALDFSRVLAIATGVFRELEELDRITARVLADTGVRVRVISGRDEATLMSRGLRDLPVTPPALLCDLGGATLEWVWLGDAGEPVCGSAPLGAIRNRYRFPDPPPEPGPIAAGSAPGPAAADYLAQSAAHCDRILAELPSAPAAQLVATGGTARALALLAGSERIATPAIAALAEQIARGGPPAALDESRREVFLPGLVILWRTALRCGAGELRYGTSAVRDGMVVRLLQLLERHQPRDLHATQLLRSTQKKL